MTKNKMTKKKYGKRLSVKDRIKIYNMYKNGYKLSEIKKIIGCGNACVYLWINKDKLYNSLMGIKKKHKKHIHKKHKKHIHTKPHKNHIIPHRKSKYADMENLTNDIITLYREHGTLNKVKEELSKKGIKLCATSISKRIPKEIKNKTRLPGEEKENKGK